MITRMHWVIAGVQQHQEVILCRATFKDFWHLWFLAYAITHDQQEHNTYQDMYNNIINKYNLYHLFNELLHNDKYAFILRLYHNLWDQFSLW